MKVNQFTYDYFCNINDHCTSLNTTEKCIQDALSFFEIGDVIKFEDGTIVTSEQELRNALINHQNQKLSDDKIKTVVGKINSMKILIYGTIISGLCTIVALFLPVPNTEGYLTVWNYLFSNLYQLNYWEEQEIAHKNHVFTTLCVIFVIFLVVLIFEGTKKKNRVTNI